MGAGGGDGGRGRGGHARSLGRTLLLKLSIRRGIGDAMARWPAARRFVHRFVAGEHAEDALRVIAQLNAQGRSEEHTSELQSRLHLVCRLLLEKKKKGNITSRQ